MAKVESIQSKVISNAAKTFVVEVFYDDCAEDPRVNENVGRMALYHRRHSLGDSTKVLGFSMNYLAEACDSWDEVKENIMQREDVAIIVPVSGYDHGGLTVSHGVLRGWDSGMLGFHYMTKKDLEESFDGDEVRGIKCLEAEIEEYNNYLQGNVYFYSVKEVEECDSCGHKHEKFLNSCGGYVGCLDECFAEGIAEANAYLSAIEV